LGFRSVFLILCMPLCEKRANSYAFVSEPRRIKPARVLARGVFDSKTHVPEIGRITNLVQSGPSCVRLRRIVALQRNNSAELDGRETIELLSSTAIIDEALE
jgi:hypothetical protein